MIQELDSTLPKELQELVKFGGPLDITTIQAQASQTNSIPENPIMTTPAENKTTSPEDIRAIASQTVNQIMAEKDSSNALAMKFENLMTKATAAETQLATANEKIVALDQALAAEKAEVVKAKKKETESADAAKKTEDDKENIIKKYNDAKASLDIANKKLADISAEKVVASRTEKLMAKKLMTKGRGEKAMARDDKGEFVLSEAAFDEYVADLEEAVASSGTSVKPSAETTKPGKGNDVPPLKVRSQAGINDEQDNEGGKASAVANEVVPALPDLSQAEVIAQATASLMARSGEAGRDKNRVNLFASTFGAG